LNEKALKSLEIFRSSGAGTLIKASVSSRTDRRTPRSQNRGSRSCYRSRTVRPHAHPCCKTVFVWRHLRKTFTEWT